MSSRFSILCLLTALFVSPASSDDFDNLLDDYKQASDLSNKTKNEAVGNLIVYTRDDLERMQANTLKDILKSMRFFSFQENRLGQPDLVSADPLVNNSASVRIYLNEHELNSAMFGSGFSKFGDIELDFIDHIEIYQGFPSFDFGTEPSTIVVRLYSRTSEHHSGGKIKAQLGTYGSNTLSTYIADETDDLSYFAYASRREEQRKDSYYEGQSLKRDQRTERVYLSLANDNHHVELHGSHAKGTAFMGSIISITDPALPRLGSGSVPSDSFSRDRYMSLSLHSTFQDKSLDLTASIMKATTETKIEYNPSLVFRPVPATGHLQINSLDGQVKEDSYTLGLTKKWDIGDHVFSTGLKFRHNHFSLSKYNPDSFLYVGVTLPPPSMPFSQPYSSTDIYAAFVQDEYAIDENQIITLSLMLERYHNKHTSIKDKTLFQNRFGYIFTNEDWVAKTFLTKEEFAPDPTQTVLPSTQYANPNLDTSSYISFLQEISYQTDATLSKLVFGYNKTKNYTSPDTNLVLQNSESDLNVLLAGFEETLTFRQNDKLELQVYVLSIDIAGSHKYENTHGAQLRMLNTVHQFDFFNELIIREHTDQFSHNSHDYNLGVIYHATKDLQFNLKGENVFDNSDQQSYITQINAATGQTDYLTTPINDRRVWIGMELLF